VPVALVFGSLGVEVTPGMKTIPNCPRRGGGA
jgi:hypothetical protein